MASPQVRHRDTSAVLHSPMFLRPEAKVVWCDAGFQLSAHDGSISHPVSPTEALALLVLGRFGSIDLADRHLSPLGPAFSAALAYVTRRYSTYLGPGVERPFASSWWGQRLSSANSKPTREAGPASITWVVTLECNRRCPYCFYKIIPVADGTRHRPRDATLSTDKALRAIAEMARIGTSDLYLTGGEPLLRDDLPDLIANAAQLGIRPHAVTKYAIDRAMALRLAESRLHHITISLDDLRAGPALLLTGIDEYPTQALASIEQCLEAGLDVEVNAVLTALNLDNLGSLAIKLAELGVPKFSISPLQPPYFRNANIRRYVTTADLNTIVHGAQAAVGVRMAVQRGGAATSEQGAGGGCAPDLVCEVGTRSLHILPNGDVTRCHYLPHRADLVVGSLERSTITEIWNSSSLAGLVDPSPDRFAGTSCHGCSGFQKCNSRGRCVASAILEHERPFAPDAFCTRGP